MEEDVVRYAVVGLGYISQIAMLPAFKNAKNSKLTALVSGDPVKLKKLSRTYDVPNIFSYEEYEECLRSGIVDAVYIALPNNMHKAYAELAAQYNVHVLCEKPLATTVDECIDMIEACRNHNVKLMTAYRLHFEEANLSAVEIANSGQLGEVRFFNSVFSQQVRDRQNYRLDQYMGGGPLYDLGIYCINAARSLFQDEPVEVLGLAAANPDDARFREVEEMASATLRFSDDRLATFTCSFGAAKRNAYEVVGSKGILTVDPAYDFGVDLNYQVTVDGDLQQKKTCRNRDQFAPELIYFSDCIIHDKEPEPSGEEGLADIRVIEAIFTSIETGGAVRIQTPRHQAIEVSHPHQQQGMRRPPVKEPKLIHAQAPGDQ